MRDLDSFESAFSTVGVVSSCDEVFWSNEEGRAELFLIASSGKRDFDEYEHGTFCSKDEGGTISFKAWLNTDNINLKEM